MPAGSMTMLTRQSTVAFNRPFTLNRQAGELPGGSYDIEIDEEEIQTPDRTAYRQVAIYFHVHNGASTRMIVITPAELELACAETGRGIASLQSQPPTSAAPICRLCRR